MPPEMPTNPLHKAAPGQETPEVPPQLWNRMVDRWSRLQFAGVGAGIMSNLTAAEQAHKWAERDMAAKHEVLYGDKGKKEAEELEMADLNLGDNIHYHAPPQPQYPQQQAPPPAAPTPAKKANWLLPAVLGATLPLAGAGLAGLGYLLSQPQQTQTSQQPAGEYVDESVSIGLGQLNDYEWIEK